LARAASTGTEVALGTGVQALREIIGGGLGSALAPLARWVSHSRRARTFHPDGLLFEARVTRAEGSALGDVLAGTALLRCSGALWRRGTQGPDALGVALRFLGEGEAPRTALRSGDQDLLLATIISPLTLPFAPLTTDTSDFLANHYWAVSPFDAPQLGRVKFRLSPVHACAPGRDREQRLRALVEAGQAAFTLEVRRTFSVGWQAVARVQPSRELSLDQRALRFSPFNAGRGLVPRGFVHALRSSVYPASQRGRDEV
jgi:hypothetical protein